MDKAEKDQFLLAQLVLMFQTAALQQMGKLKNPLTDKVERDLSQAQISIDIIEMLQNKMKGNLSQEEDRMISSVLQELKLNFVDEHKKEQSTAPATPPPASGEPAAST